MDEGNDQQDRSIVPYGNPVLYAYGPGTLSYHGSRRASTRVTFYTPEDQGKEDDDVMPVETSEANIRDDVVSEELPDDVDGWFDVVNTNFTVPDGTAYACKSSLIPLLDSGQRMIVGGKPLFNESQPAIKEVVHHFTFYVCSGDEYAERTKNTVRCNEPGLSSYGPFVNGFSNCSTVILGCKLFILNILVKFSIF